MILINFKKYKKYLKAFSMLSGCTFCYYLLLPEPELRELEPELDEDPDEPLLRTVPEEREEPEEPDDRLGV